MRIKTRVVCILLSLLFVSACAYSPQRITVIPASYQGGEHYGNGRIAEVFVEDVRAQKALGSRGGSYPETSTITLGNDLADAVKRAVNASLAAEGFTVNSPSNPSFTLRIRIEELTYRKPKSWWSDIVELTAVFSTEITGANKKYEGRYRTQSRHQHLIVANKKKNTRIINTALTQTLEQLFSDPKMQAFISNL